MRLVPVPGAGCGRPDASSASSRVESLVWGAYFLGRSALRLAFLLHGGLGSFLVVTFVTGTPVMLLLLAWSVRYSMRRLADVEPPA